MYIYVYVYMYICIYVYVYVYMYIYVYVYMYIYVYVYMYIYVYVYMYMYMCVCVCDAIWENPSDVARLRLQDIRKIGWMPFFVKIRFSLTYYSITSGLSSLKISWQT